MRICLIGAGNLATHLGIALTEKGHQVVQVWSQSEKHASQLATRLNTSSTTDINLITSDTEIYLIAIKDNYIASFLSQIQWGNKLVLHTSGTISMDIFAPYCLNFGVLYPFQTFSIDKKIDFEPVPVYIEANTPQNLEVLNQLAHSISNNVTQLNSIQRQQIHLAAVFVCNFVNHFYTIGKELLLEKGIGFDILRPLILETANKAVVQSPEASQTGPAVRKDQTVMDKHLEMLANHPDLKKLYQQISQRIIQTHI